MSTRFAGRLGRGFGRGRGILNRKSEHASYFVSVFVDIDLLSPQRCSFRFEPSSIS